MNRVTITTGPDAASGGVVATFTIGVENTFTLDRARIFTLDEFVADPYSPHRGNREATRAMLVRCGVPFVEVAAVASQF